MSIHYNVPGKKRKELAQVIGTWFGAEVKYVGAPSFAYRIGTATLDKDGNLSFEGCNEPAMIERLQQHLYDEGFECDLNETVTTESTGLTVSVPLENVAVGNLTNLLDAKGQLIRKALGVKNLHIQVDEEKVSFPWFEQTPDSEMVSAISHFIAAICKMSIDQKRISPKEKDIENEKYAFRCFLLRLGFIGNEYKAERKILLRNLSGSAAFKSGQAKEVAVCE